MDSQDRSATARPVRWSAAGWCAYFRANAKSLLDIPWEWGAELTEAERGAVAASLQDFQLGESSDGRHLIRAARDYAQRTGDAHYEPAIRLFVAEEQRHARDLGRFLTLAGIPLLRHSTIDLVFRCVRRLAGLELSLTVLVTAEMIGKVYYRALRQATASRLLERLCDQLLRDEVKHIRFHVERLALLRRGRSRWQRGLARLGHRFLFGGACLAVWCKHGRALRAGGYSFGRFWREAWSGLSRALRPIAPADLVPFPAEPRQILPMGQDTHA